MQCQFFGTGFICHNDATTALLSNGKIMGHVCDTHALMDYPEVDEKRKMQNGAAWSRHPKCKHKGCPRRTANVYCNQHIMDGRRHVSQ